MICRCWYSCVVDFIFPYKSYSYFDSYVHVYFTYLQVNKERVQDAKGDNEVDDGGCYKPTKSTLRAAPSTKTYRLPHVALAARFEKEIIGLWNSRFAGAFQYPVPRTIRGYYEKIRNPISLLDIRNRNGELILFKI